MNVEYTLWLQTRLMYYQENINAFRCLDLNVGYPVLALGFGQIEYLAHMLYSTEKKRSSTLLSGKYIAEEMVCVNPIYGFKFSRAFELPWGKAHSFGELLYLTLRSKLHHQGGHYPPFSVTAKTEHEYLHMQFEESTKYLIVHAYIMNDELQSSISTLYREILAEERSVEQLALNIEKERRLLDDYSTGVLPMIEELKAAGFFS